MRRPLPAVVAMAALVAAGCGPLRSVMGSKPLTREGMVRALSGTWDGVYHYPAEDLRGRPVEKPPVAFRVNIECRGVTFTGRLVETAGAGGRTKELRAAVRGNVQPDGRLLFTKEFDESAGEIRLVVYQGEFDRRGNVIRGTWTIPGNWSGVFRMKRLPQEPVEPVEPEKRLPEGLR